VGNADLGGDWGLDACVGSVEAVSVLSPEKQAQYMGVLTTGNPLGVFFATDATHGTELWVTDGTTAGTSLLKDIYTGLNSGFSMPASLQSFAALGNGKVVFNANNGVNGTELWITDGTSAGTNMVKDIYAGLSSSMSYGLTSIGNGKALFGATDATNGIELWITDGTAAGTNLVQDIATGIAGSIPVAYIALGNGKAIFSTSVAGTMEQWITDGTSAGTVAFKDVFFAGTGFLPNSPNYNLLTSLGNGKAVFSAYDGVNGTELWITDGTPAGTSLVKDIKTGLNSSYPDYITSLGNGKAVFTASDATNGHELWITDGTAAGTNLLKDTANLISLTSLGNGKIVFTVYDYSINGSALWVTDGTTVGTYLVKDVAAGSSISYPSNFTSLGYGKAMFSATNALYITEQWITDGTSLGTMLLSTANASSGYSNPTSYSTIGNGKVLFSATDATNGTELWITDGTTAGTSILKDINLATASSNPSPVTMLDIAPTLAIPATVNYIDTPVVNSFADATGTLQGNDVDAGTTLTYGITGGTDNGTTVSKANAYGTLIVTKATGAYSFVANSAAIEPLNTTANDTSLSVTVSDSIATASQIFTVNIAQSGVTESNGNDTITGTAGVDVISSLAGDDIINGGAGADSMIGGAGNDGYYVDNVNDVIVETAYAGTLPQQWDYVYSSTATYTLSANVEALVLVEGSAATTAVGNTGYNYFVGNSAADIFDGKGGGDFMVGGKGNDTYNIYNSYDNIVEYAGEGWDTLWTMGNYVLPANVEALLFYSMAGNSNGYGNNDINYLVGNIYNNLLDGQGGNDSLVGSNGSDTLVGSLGQDYLDLSETVAATDTIRIATGDSTVGFGNYDFAVGFKLGTGTVSTTGVDQLDLVSTTIASNAAAVNGTNAGAIMSHSITNGIISFAASDTFAAAPIAMTDGYLSSAFSYLQANITGSQTLGFVCSGNTYVFQDAGVVDTLVELVGVVATSLNTTGLAAGAVWIV
jgi:ELWxxDGT repeat protein